MLKPMNMASIMGAMAAHSVMAAAAERAHDREETICRLAALVGDRGEAQRAVEMAERVGLDARAIYSIAARGEPLPRTAEEPLATCDAGQRRADDLAKILGSR